MIPALVVFAYLGVVLCVGVLAFRTAGGPSNAEEYFLAGRSLGPTVFLLSLFGANMTAFSILGASGHAFARPGPATLARYFELSSCLRGLQVQPAPVPRPQPAPVAG